MEDSKELLVSKCLCRWQTLEADYKDKYSTALTDRPLCGKTATYQTSFFNSGIKLWNLICKLIRPCDFLNIKTFKNSITNLFKDELANVFDLDKPCSWGLPRNCDATGNNGLHTILILFTDLIGGGASHGTPGPVCTLPFGRFFFSFIVYHYLF